MGSEQNSNRISSINWNKAARRLTLIIGIGIILNLFFTYFLSGDFQFDKLIQFAPGYLLAAFGLAIYPWIAHAFEIMIWANMFKRPLGFRSALQVSVATDLGAAITPTMVGGAPIKLGMLMRKGLTSGQAAAMVVFTGLEDMIFFLIIIPVSICFSDRIGFDVLAGLGNKAGEQARIYMIAAGVLAILVLVFSILARKYALMERIRIRLNSILVDFKAAVVLIGKEGKMHFLLATLAIITRWISRFLILICLIRGLELFAGAGGSAKYLEVFLSEWMVYLGMTVTPTPGAIGGAEGAFYLVYKGLIAQEDIGVIITVWRFFNYYLILMLSAIYLNISIRKGLIS